MELIVHSFLKLCKIPYLHWVKDAESSQGARHQHNLIAPVLVQTDCIVTLCRELLT